MHYALLFMIIFIHSIFALEFHFLSSFFLSFDLKSVLLEGACNEKEGKIKEKRGRKTNKRMCTANRMKSVFWSCHKQKEHKKDRSHDYVKGANNDVCSSKLMA